MFKLIFRLLLVLFMAGSLAATIGCRSNSGAGGTYAPFGAPTYTPAGGPTPPPASSGGGSCPHCK